MQKKVLMIEPDKEQADLFADWLKDEAYSVTVIDKPQDVQGFLAKEKFDILLIDIDEPGMTESFLMLCRALKADERFTGLPIAVLTYRKDSRKIAGAIEAGVDSFMLKPFETDAFLARMETIFKQVELNKQGKKVLDLNYINYLIALAGEAEREDFFALAPVIFNKLILEKINTVLGDPVIAQIIKRVNELVGGDYGFMKPVEFFGKVLSLSGVDKASKEVPIKKITIAFRDYVYAFLHLVRTLTSDILMERETTG